MIIQIMSIIFALSAHAKEVKILKISENQIYPLMLALGKTTLLRFEEKPQRLIIGNKNYFNVENNDYDIALQPLAKVETNLFVYTSKQTFSFNIKVCDSCANDDFVKVESKVINQKFVFPVKNRPLKELKIDGKLQFKEFTLYIQKITTKDHSAFVDILALANKETSLSKEIELQVEAGKKLLTDVELAFDDKANSGLRGRIYFPIKPKNETKLIFIFNKKKQIFVLQRRHLS